MNDIHVDVHFSGTTGTAEVTVSRIYGVTTLLEGTLTVYKKVGTRWVYVDSVTGSSARTLCLDFDFNAVRGTTYKVVASITAHGEDDSETDSASKEKVCP